MTAPEYLSFHHIIVSDWIGDFIYFSVLSAQVDFHGDGEGYRSSCKFPENSPHKQPTKVSPGFQSVAPNFPSKAAESEMKGSLIK